MFLFEDPSFAQNDSFMPTFSVTHCKLFGIRVNTCMMIYSFYTVSQIDLNRGLKSLNTYLTVCECQHPLVTRIRQRSERGFTLEVDTAGPSDDALVDMSIESY